eukprot:364861-Chlamydomonas_euryale.AAC.2
MTVGSHATAATLSTTTSAYFPRQKRCVVRVCAPWGGGGGRTLLFGRLRGAYSLVLRLCRLCRAFPAARSLWECPKPCKVPCLCRCAVALGNAQSHAKCRVSAAARSPWEMPRAMQSAVSLPLRGRPWEMPKAMQSAMSLPLRGRPGKCPEQSVVRQWMGNGWRIGGKVDKGMQGTRLPMQAWRLACGQRPLSCRRCCCRRCCCRLCRHAAPQRVVQAH